MDLIFNDKQTNPDEKYSTGTDYLKNDIGVYFLDNKCPICLNRMKLITGYIPLHGDTNISYHCDKCGFSSIINHGKKFRDNKPGCTNINNFIIKFGYSNNYEMMKVRAIQKVDNYENSSLDI
jgi:hypothetical protein